jgi:hypothetical protein
MVKDVCFKEISWHVSEQTDANHEATQSREPASWPRMELGTIKIQISNVTKTLQSTASLGNN